MDSPFIKGKRKSLKKGLGKWESFLEEELKTKNKDYRTRIFASSAGLCERQTAGLLFLPKGSESMRKASTEFYFKMGNVFEDIINQAFLKANILVDRETRIEAYHDKLPISGRIDFVIENPYDIDGKSELILVELKSCGKLPASPRPAHKAQLMTYLALTGMPKGIVWYISRHIASWDGVLIQRAFEIEPTNEEIKEVVFKLALGSLAVKKSLLPHIPFDMKRYKCGFCNLIPYCWENKKDFLVDIKQPGPKETALLIDEANLIVKEVMIYRDELRKQFENLMAR